MGVVDVEKGFYSTLHFVFFDRIRSYKATCNLIRNHGAGSGVDGAPNQTSDTEGSPTTVKDERELSQSQRI